MSVEKKPFVNYRVGEKNPDKEGKIITMRLNSEEYKKLKEDMKILNQNNESTTIKLFAEAGRNVIHNTFSVNTLRWLSDPKRRIRE